MVSWNLIGQAESSEPHDFIWPLATVYSNEIKWRYYFFFFWKKKSNKIWFPKKEIASGKLLRLLSMTDGVDTHTFFFFPFFLSFLFWVVLFFLSRLYLSGAGCPVSFRIPSNGQTEWTVSRALLDVTYESFNFCSNFFINLKKSKQEIENGDWNILVRISFMYGCWNMQFECIIFVVVVFVFFFKFSSQSHS